MEKEELGCLGIWESDKDYVLCNWDEKLLPTLYKKDEIRIEYNQRKWRWGRVSCTIFAAMWMYSDLTNYEFSEAEAKEIDDTSYNNPDYAHIRTPWHWWYVAEAVNHVRKYVNNRKDLVDKYGKVASYRISKYDDDMINYALDNLYTIDWNLCPTWEYITDYSADWMLDWTNFGYNTNWHSVCAIKKDWQLSIKDNYKWTQYNIYWLKNALSKITNIWPNFYVYTLVKEDNLEGIKRLNEIKSECNVLIEHLWKLRHLVNDTNFQWILHYTADKLRAKIKECNEMLGKLW